MKYSKWKAADIAKAFREGRQPAAGPAASEVHSDLISPETSTSFQPSASTSIKTPSPVPQPPTTPPKIFRDPSPSTGLARSPKRQSSPPKMSPSDLARANNLPIQRGAKHDDETLTSGQWSTTATPGYDLAHEHGLEPSISRTAWVSSEMEGVPSDEETKRDPRLNAKRPREKSPRKVQFLNNTETITPPSSSPPRVYAAQQRASSTSPPRGRSDRSISPQDTVTDLPPGFVPSGPPIPPSVGEYTPVFGTDSLPSVPPPPSPTMLFASSPPMSHPSMHTSPPFELTPSIIAKAQKHCRFAVSSLDYEDVEQARKELRTALGLLGG